MTSATAPSLQQLPPEHDSWGCSLHWQSRAQLSAKRGIDLVGACLLLCLVLPVVLIVALLIRRSSSGPILLRQMRVGRNGRTFTLYKFRTMYDRNDSAAHQAYYRALVADTAAPIAGVFKLINDPRITPVGRALRRLSIDELPQLLNVIRGDMSLVGPRPPLLYESALYDARARRRLLVAPGLTGLWQVSGRNALNFHQMVALDLDYISCWSIILDLRILFRTPLAVLRTVGAG